jgi:hemerythrin-like domain-containing protein
MAKAVKSSLSNGLLKHLEALQNLCSDLEAIADSLPASINVQGSLGVAQTMLSIVHSAHQFEENNIYPMFTQNTVLNDAMLKHIERLKFEHWADEDYAEEVYHALREFIANQNKIKAETLSWMLRGFFESMRRHVAFERAVILPAIANSESISYG